MSRHARIELRPADMTWLTTTDTSGMTWEDARPLSKRPHYLRLVAANGAVLATSEVYSTRQNARRAVDAWVAAFFTVARFHGGIGGRTVVVEFDADGREVTR